MIAKIKENGVEREIDVKDIIVDEKPLEDWVKDIKSNSKDIKGLIELYEKREENTLKLWRLLK